MDFKKCKRCGCFFLANGDVCPKCEPKDNMEMARLKDFLDTNENYSINELSNILSITPANLNRYISNGNFKKTYKNINSSIEGFNNISISL